MKLDAKKKVLLGASRETVMERVSELPQPVVFTNGCFDILHRGHVTYLESARNLGASLVLGLNTDASVKRQNKGEDRPMNQLADRAAVIASLACIDLVIDFDADTPIELIEWVSPQHLVKGGDWKVDDIVGASFVRENGGYVHSIPFEHDRSTTKLINKIRNQ